MLIQWQSRKEAGRALARALTDYSGAQTIVLGLPRGGVVVAAEVAKTLGADLGVLVARKIGHPHHHEYAIGAVTETGKPILNEAETSGLSQEWLEKEIAKERQEAKRRREFYEQASGPKNIAGKTVVIVDDGIATGLTLLAAIADIRLQKPAKIVVAVPVAPEDTAMQIENEVDAFVCLECEDDYFSSVGSYYNNFEQIEDQEVYTILKGV